MDAVLLWQGVYGKVVQMKTKLTVRVDDQLIQSAKLYARKRGISLSHLIENYLSSLAFEQDEPLVQTPILQRLSGILPKDASILDHHKHWEDKYG
jgi:hypothetical protein